MLEVLIYINRYNIYENLNAIIAYGNLFVWLVVFNAIFNNISVISWRSETGGPGENHRPVASHWFFFNHIYMLYTSPWSRFELTTSVVIGTDCIGSSKSNYHTITATRYGILYIFLNEKNYYMFISPILTMEILSRILSLYYILYLILPFGIIFCVSYVGKKCIWPDVGFIL